MCKHKSYVCVKRTDEGIDIYGCDDSDSHEKIRKRHNIRDTTTTSGRQCSVELQPVDITDPATWTLRFDDAKPDWWGDEHEAKLRKRLASDHAKRWDASKRAYSAGGDLYLSSLTSVPEGVTLSAGGDLDLRSLTSVPEGVTLSAGGYLYLRSLTSVPEGVTLSAGGDLYLSSLTSVPEGVTLSAGGYLDLRSLTSVPEGVTVKSMHVILKK